MMLPGIEEPLIDNDCTGRCCGGNIRHALKNVVIDVEKPEGVIGAGGASCHECHSQSALADRR